VRASTSSILQEGLSGKYCAPSIERVSRSFAAVSIAYNMMHIERDAYLGRLIVSHGVAWYKRKADVGKQWTVVLFFLHPDCV